MFSYSAIKKPAIKVLEVFLKHTRTHTLAGKSIPSHKRTVVGVRNGFRAPGQAQRLETSQSNLWEDTI